MWRELLVVLVVFAALWLALVTVPWTTYNRMVRAEQMVERLQAENLSIRTAFQQCNLTRKKK